MDWRGAAEPGPCKEAVKVRIEAADVRGYNEAQDGSMASYGLTEGLAFSPAMCITQFLLVSSPYLIVSTGQMGSRSGSQR